VVVLVARKRSYATTAAAVAPPPETGRTAETTATSRLADAAAGRLPPDRRFRYPSSGGDPEPVACAFRVRILSVFFLFSFEFFRIILERHQSILCEMFCRK